MSSSKGQSFLHGAAIYTGGIIVVKILGFIYKFILMRILTDQGYAYFKVAYNIFNVFLTVSTAGIPVALSRMISEAHTLGRERQARRVFSVAFLTLTALGGISTLIMLLFPENLAIYFGSVHAAEGIFVMAPTVLLVCMIAAFRGYAQGHADMVPTTVSQIIETAVKVLAGLSLSVLFARAGKNESITAAGAIAGTTVSSLVTLVYIFFAVRRRFAFRLSSAAEGEPPEKYAAVFWAFLKISIPIAISESVLSLVNLLDTKLVLNQLQVAGFSADASEGLFAVYTKAMDLYNLPYYFVIPLGASIMPAISAARVRENHAETRRLAEDALRIMSLLCLPMAAGIAVLSKPCMELILNCTAAQGPALLVMMAIASYFMTFAVMTNYILPANGYERVPIYAILAGGAAKILVNYLLVRNPQIHIYGAPVGTVCCYFTVALVNFICMARTMKGRVRLVKILGRSLPAALIMGAAAYAVWMAASRALSSSFIPFVLSVAVGVAVYGVLIVALRAITREDLKMIPHGERLANLLHIK